MSQTSFPLRIHDEERNRAKRLAETLGISENRLYAELIHDGLLMREQMQYLSQLDRLARETSPEQALAILDKVAGNAPTATDLY